MLLAPLAVVLPRSHPLGLQEGLDDRRARPSLGFLQERGERGQGGLPADDRAVLSELHLVESTLAEPPEPAVECREVRLRGGGVVLLDRGAKGTGTREVDLGEVRNDGKREGLVGQEVKRE